MKNFPDRNCIGIDVTFRCVDPGLYHFRCLPSYRKRFIIGYLIGLALLRKPKVGDFDDIIFNV